MIAMKSILLVLAFAGSLAAAPGLAAFEPWGFSSVVQRAARDQNFSIVISRTHPGLETRETRGTRRRHPIREGTDL
jgi:hypothetical protein